MHDFSEIVSLVKAASDSVQNVIGSDLRRLRAARDVLSKSADFGADNTAAFEKAFGAVAYTYLQEKVPNLIQYIVGFQLIDHDPEANTASGVFVAQIGNTIIDVPMFFKNNELKGHVLMRMRDPELFLPLREAFLDYMVSRMPQDIGEATTPQDQLSNVPSQPDMTAFDPSVMMMGKTSADIEWVSQWARDYDVPAQYVKMTCEPKNLKLAMAMRDKDCAGKVVNLVDFIGASEEMLKSAADLADKYPQFEAGMTKIYGADWMEKAVNKLADLKCPGDPVQLPSEDNLLKLSGEECVDIGYVRIYNDVPAFADSAETDLALQELKKFGDYIEDKRIPSEVTDVVEISEPINLSPPPASGIFNILMADGGFERKVVILSSAMVGGRAPSGKDMIIDPSSKEFCFIDPTNYAAGDKIGGEDFDSRLEWNKLLAEAQSNPTVGDVGVFVTKGGQATGIVRIDSKDADDTYSICHESTYRYDIDLPYGMYSPSGYARRKGEDCKTLRMFDGFDGSHISISGEVIAIPSSAKFLKLYNAPSDYYESPMPVRREEKRPDVLKIARTASMSFSDLHKATRVKLRKLGSDSFELNGRMMNASDLRKTLVFSAGIDKTAAEAMIDQQAGTHRYLFVPAGANLSIGALIKQANATYNEPYLPFPNFEGPMPGNTGNYQVVNGGQEQISMAPYDPTRQPLGEGEDPHDNLAQGMPGSLDEGMIDSGLWDVSGLKTIIMNSRIDNDIRLTSKTLLSSIDRLGRQILSFYANTDEYADLYGEDEINTLEEGLLNTFEGAGDLFISLTRKSAGPDSQLDIATLASSMAGE